MKTYTIELTLIEECDEFWDSITNTGCDEVIALITEILDSRGFGFGSTIVKLVKFEDV